MLAFAGGVAWMAPEGVPGGGVAWMALEQLEWAIGYLRWSGIAGARHTTAVLDRNRDHIARSIR